MKPVLTGSLFCLLCVGVYAAPSDIATSQRRAAVLAMADGLAKPTAAEGLLVSEDIKNPFNPIIEVHEARPNRPASDRDLLLLLSEQIKPTGVMGRDDALILLLKGQKGVKVGEKLTLSFDGVNYEVEITSIDRTNFSLRYNQAEFTRPIKTGKNP